ncbi:MAG: SDR family NAD(P)-dependent oxidoreductase [Armatimonadota bacterium]
MINLDRRVAFVTGGAHGIGRAVGQALCNAGATVIFADIDEAGAADVALELGDRALGTFIDVASSDAVQAAVDRAIEVFGGVDILVNSAGICRRGRILEISEAEWDQVIAVNLKGAFLCCKAVVPYMIKGGWGRIVNIASLAGKIGGLMVGLPYAASKGGVLALTKGLARELAEYGITVNAVCPSLVDTDMARMFTPADIENYLKGVPLRRLATAEDIAEAVLYLCSPGAAYVTGEVLDVNGGILMD